MKVFENLIQTLTNEVINPKACGVQRKGAKPKTNFFKAEWICFTFFFQSGQIYMKDAESAETNEKSLFRILVIEIWTFL